MRFSMEGRIERTSDTTLVISELPVRVWTQTYKELLEKMMIPDPKTNPEPQIKDFAENHTESTVSFTITTDKEKIDEWEKLPKGGLYSKFKLTSSLTNTNMTAFDVDAKIVKYEKPEDIMKEFYNHRMEFYVRRKAILVQKLEREQKMLSNKARFVEEVCSGELVVSNRKKVELLQNLQERGYEMFDKTEKSQENEEEVDEEEEASTATLSKGYEYLLGMKIWSLTYEKAEELHRQLEERTAELKALQATSPSDIWLRDLDNIEIALDERDAEMEEAEADEQRARTKNKKHQTSKAKKAAANKNKGKKKADQWDSDLEDDSEDEQVDLDDSDVEIQVAKKSAAPRKPAATKKPTAKAPAPKVAAVKKITAAPSAIVPPQPKVVEAPPQVDDVELSLAERMARLLSPSKAAAVPSNSTKVASISTGLSFSDEDGEETRGTKRPSPRTSDTDDDESLGAPVAKPTTKPKAKRTKAAATKKAAPKKAPATKGRKKKQPESDSESEDDFAFDNEVEEVAAPPVQRAGGRSARAAAKKVVYALSSDEEGSDSDFE